MFLSDQDIPAISYNTNIELTFDIARGLGSLDELKSRRIQQTTGLLNVFSSPLQQEYQKYLTSGTTIQYVTEREKNVVLARLISFVLLDPDTNLVNNYPEKVLVYHGGMRIVKGLDDRGFLMDMAPELKEELNRHNDILSRLTYENDKGETKAFKKRKLSDLEVVVWLHKELK